MAKPTRSILPQGVGRLPKSLIKKVREGIPSYEYNVCDFQFFRLMQIRADVAARKTEFYAAEALVEATECIANICGCEVDQFDIRAGVYSGSDWSKGVGQPHVDTDAKPSEDVFVPEAKICVIGPPTRAYLGKFNFNHLTGVSYPIGSLKEVTLEEGVVYKINDQTLHSEPPLPKRPTPRVFWRHYSNIER